MPSPSLSYPLASMPQPRWARGFLCAIAVHVALVLLFYWPPQPLPPMQLAPPAVMMSWAAQIEAPESPKPLPLGVQQAESSAAQPAEPQDQPDLPKLARAEKTKISVAEKKRTEHRPAQKAQPKPEEQVKEIRHAAASSAAAPKALNIARQTAAPLNSDSASNEQVKLSWESRVKGMLNRIKRYPPDAQRRRRTGMPQVSFSVDAQGRVFDLTLHAPSGTASLDREALSVVMRAQPLPPPPVEMLQQGNVQVTMPIDFNLAALDASQ
ncbi:TonB family protein [Serratia proteamaculans]|uniref:TonB family protein n=1 Tax=Serratia proteamaculans TaxID=28151 RepID=UPI00217AC50D|nr:energy transducer TonB [Serratia proteamaculans]CAI0692500.1 transport protein TonB [Serratia proteamaculans]CAI0693289.1 transport protein TonB [Serratia proteamaculans]